MKLIVFAVVLLALVCLALLVTDTCVLIWETKVQPGQTYIVTGGGDVGEGTLVCCYFTGRKVVTTVVRYSPNNMLGRDSCRFLDRP